jgi:RNA chaperone Hfq
MFVAHLRNSRSEVTVLLTTRIKLQSHIKEFDDFRLQPVRVNSSQIVYKDAITAIYPAVPIDLTGPTSSG